MGKRCLRLIEESIAKSNPMKHVDANNIKQIESFPPMHGDKIGQNNSIETNNKNEHIVELENYKEHKSEYETNTVENVTFHDYSTAVSQQGHVIEETENKLYEEIKAFVIAITTNLAISFAKKIQNQPYKGCTIY